MPLSRCNEVKLSVCRHHARERGSLVLLEPLFKMLSLLMRLTPLSAEELECCDCGSGKAELLVAQARRSFWKVVVLWGKE